MPMRKCENCGGTCYRCASELPELAKNRRNANDMRPHELPFLFLLNSSSIVFRCQIQVCLGHLRHLWTARRL